MRTDHQERIISDAQSEYLDDYRVERLLECGSRGFLNLDLEAHFAEIRAKQFRAVPDEDERNQCCSKLEREARREWCFSKGALVSPAVKALYARHAAFTTAMLRAPFRCQLGLYAATDDEGFEMSAELHEMRGYVGLTDAGDIATVEAEWLARMSDFNAKLAAFDRSSRYEEMMGVRSEVNDLRVLAALRMCRWAEVQSGSWTRAWSSLFRDRDTPWHAYFSLLMAAFDRERMATSEGRAALAKRKARWEAKPTVKAARAAAKRARRAEMKAAGVVSSPDEKVARARRAREARAARRAG